MNQNRRNFLRGTSLLGASLAAVKNTNAQHENHQPQGKLPDAQQQPFLPVITPDAPKLPYKLDNGVKEFHLIAEPVRTEFLPAASWADARKVDAWGYNGSVPGPTIEVQEGDRVRILFTNNLPEPTAPHWHGLEVPFDQDGGPGLSQPLVMSGETYTYEFMLHQNGTFFYHSHMPMQEMMGMIGLFIVHPKRPHEPRCDKDFAFVLQGWAILPNNTVPNTLAMEFNWLTMNGKSGPATTPQIVKHGERVRLRFVNLSMDHHPIHMHGHQFYLTGTEGGRCPEATWFAHNTHIVGVAQARDLEFTATNLGDWMMHCHLPHHMMNQMVSMVGPMMHNQHSEHDNPTTQAAMYACPMHPEVRSDKAGKCPKCGMVLAMPKSPTMMNGKRVPGYPQDMWMTMDAEVARPEASWLPVGWTGSMMGMMTLIRVLPPDKYERMLTLVKEGKYEPGAELGKPGAGHQHKQSE